MHRDEAYNLLCHLWKYPPQFVTTKVESAPTRRREADSMTLDSPPEHSKGGSSLGGSAEKGLGSGGAWGGGGAWSGGSGGVWGNVSGGGGSRTSSSSREKGESDGGGGGGWGGSQQKQKLTAKDVDTAASENALRVAYEARNMGVDTMLELEMQASTYNLFSFCLLSF